MKKRYGYSLAETMVALSIVGVIALLVMPIIKSKMQDISNLSKLQKVYNSLTDAVGSWMVDDRISEIRKTSYISAHPELFIPKYLRTMQESNTSTEGLLGKVYTDRNSHQFRVDFQDKYDCALLQNGSTLCLTPYNDDTYITRYGASDGNDVLTKTKFVMSDTNSCKGFGTYNNNNKTIITAGKAEDDIRKAISSLDTYKSDLKGTINLINQNPNCNSIPFHMDLGDGSTYDNEVSETMTILFKTCDFAEENNTTDMCQLLLKIPEFVKLYEQWNDNDKNFATYFLNNYPIENDDGSDGCYRDINEHMLLVGDVFKSHVMEDYYELKYQKTQQCLNKDFSVKSTYYNCEYNSNVALEKLKNGEGLCSNYRSYLTKYGATGCDCLILSKFEENCPHMVPVVGRIDLPIYSRNRIRNCAEKTTYEETVPAEPTYVAPSESGKVNISQEQVHAHSSDKPIMEVVVDTNGASKPNKLGTDLFIFYIYPDGHVGVRSQDTSTNNCYMNQYYQCFKAVFNNDWKKPY